MEASERNESDVKPLVRTHLAADGTIVMLLFVVLLQLIIVIEMFVALLTIAVPG